MTRLRGLEPIDVNLWTRERLWSYLLRLSEQHGLLVGDLVEDVIWPESGWPENKRRRLNGFRSFGYIDGAGQVAKEWVEVLQRLTGRTDLSRLTLLGAEGVARFEGLGRETGARCIECAREAVELGSECYEPLVWAFGNYTRCLVHNVVVADHCAACGSSDLAMVRKCARICCCGKCGKWMGGPEFQAEAGDEASRFEYAVCEGVRDLVSILDAPTLPRVDGTAVLEYAAKIAFDGNYAAMARCIGMPKNTLSVIVSRRTRPRFDALLALSIGTGVPLKHLLLGSVTGRRFRTARLQEPIEVPCVVDRERRPALDIVNAKKELRRALRRSRATSLSAVARGLDVSTRVLREHCRGLSDDVSRRYAEQSHAKSQASKKKSERRVLAAFSACVLSDNFPTGRRLIESFGATLRSRENWTFYHQTMEKYGLEGFGREPAPLQVNALRRAQRMLVEENLQRPSDTPLTRTLSPDARSRTASRC